MNILKTKNSTVEREEITTDPHPAPQKNMLPDNSFHLSDDKC